MVVKEEIREEIALILCSECGTIIDKGLCSYECPQDSTFPEDRLYILRAVYKLEKVEELTLVNRRKEE